MKSRLTTTAQIALPALACAFFTYFAYSLGFTGTLFYDDHANLGGLSKITDLASAWAFVEAGAGGPLGRPLSLITFLPHAEGWPNNSAEIHRVNTILHLINAGLLFWLGSLLLQLNMETHTTRRHLIALSAAVLWAILPILVSTNLIAVQRMTSLSAFFGLLGLIGFTSSYHLLKRQPVFAYLLQMIALATGTALAILSKENGVLIPVFALVIDSILLRDFPQGDKVSRLRRATLLLSLAIILIYLSPIFQDWFSVSQLRGYTAWDRLISQPEILWEYVHMAFLPQAPTAYGPFHDDVGLPTNLARPIIALLAWLACLLFAFKWLHRSPLPLFALLWFLTGHLLESTTIQLELFFEHRNYLAIYGACLMLAYFAWNAPGKLRRVGPVLFGSYTLLLWGIMLAVTLRWGDPIKSAQSWTEAHPSSARAALHSVFLEVGMQDHSVHNENKATLTIPKTEYALRILDRTKTLCPDCIDVRLQALLYSCSITTEQDTAERFADIKNMAGKGTISIAVIDLLFPLREVINRNICKPLTTESITELLDTLLNNPGSKVEIFNIRLHFIAAMIDEDRHAYETALHHLALAEMDRPSALPILQYQVHLYHKLNRHDAALAAIERRRAIASNAGHGSISPADIEELTRLVEKNANQ